MTKIRLLVIPGNFIPNVGGLETHVANFVKFLKKKYPDIYDIVVFTPLLNGTKMEEIIENNLVLRYPIFSSIKIIPIPNIFKIQFWKVFLKVFKFRFDIVMTRSVCFPSSIFFGLIFSKFRFKRSKLIHVEHGSDYSRVNSRFLSFFSKFYHHFFGGILLYFSDYVVGVSKGAIKFSKKLSIKRLKNCKVIYRGIDDINIINSSEFYFKKRDKIRFLNLKFSKFKNFKVSYRDKVLVFAGRLSYGKGVQDILKVLNILKIKGYKFKFLIIGDGSYKSDLIKLVQDFNLETSVCFLGFLPREEIFSILRASDIFVHLSYAEGLPTSVLEALFSKVDILATDVGGTREILGKYWNKVPNYKLVKSCSIKSSVSKLISLFNLKSSSKSYRMKAQVISERRKIFSWDHHVEEYHKLFHQILKK